MARDRPFLSSMNGGLVSPLALARTDLKRMALTAEVFQNAFPRVIGPMQFRGGLKYLHSTKGDAQAKQIPFIFSVDDTAMLVMTDQTMRVEINDVEVTRVAVATVVTNGDFSSAGGWTLTTTGGGISTISGGVLTMQTPVRGGTTSASTSSTVAVGDQAKEHAIRLIISNGTVKFRIGSTSGGQEILAEADYDQGVHSLVFTPNVGTIYFQLSAKSETKVIVNNLIIEATGVMELTTPWLAAGLAAIRHDQSGDVIFAADGVSAPRRIERRGNPRAWSIVTYKFVDGPFRGKTANVTLTPSVRLGNGILTASAPFFNAKHVGALFEITHTKTGVVVSLAGNDQWSDSVRISGKNEGATRSSIFTISGTWNAQVTLQTSVDNEETWQDYSSYANSTVSVQLGTDNEILYERIGLHAPFYISGQVDINLSIPSGGGTGVVRITGYTDSTHATYEVVTRLHDTSATESWQEGKYSDLRGWPYSLHFHEGRLWFGGKDQIAGSSSDDFTGFNVNDVTAAGPIIRSIATGPVNKVQWLLGLSRLIIGTSGAESVPRSSSFDEPMTSTNFSIKNASTYGSADVQAVKVDKEGFFVQRSKKRAYVLTWDASTQDYATNEMSRYNPTMLNAGVTVMAVQRQPDTRIWFCLGDGTAACLIYEKNEDVIAWVTFVTDGLIEDIAVLPNLLSDDVFMVVNRTINGVTKRYREKLAYDTQAMGGTDNYMSDAYIIADLVATATITGLGHLQGKSVVVWAAGNPLLDASGNPALFVVAAGQITLPAAVTGRVIVGLYYEGQWKSTKLAYASRLGTAMSQKKIIEVVAPILYATHTRGPLFGSNFTGNMDALPRFIKGADVGASVLLTDFDYDAFALPGQWTNDSRVCIKMRAPMPVTVLGIVISMESHENG